MFISYFFINEYAFFFFFFFKKKKKKKKKKREINIIIKNILFLIYFLISIVNSHNVSINNEEELINTIENYNLDEELKININDNSIDLSNKITINSNIKKLSLVGSSKDTSILKFENSNNGFLFDSISEITLTKLTIIGNLNFVKNKNIIFNDVKLNGGLDVEETYDWNLYHSLNNQNQYDTFYLENLSLYIQFKDFQYIGSSQEKENCINLFGNVIIDNSTFQGSSSCRDSLVSYDGEDRNSITITNTYFDGNYSNNCLSIYQAKSSSIELSHFEKGGAYQNGG